MKEMLVHLCPVLLILLLRSLPKPTIAAADISEATIVARRKGLSEDNLMIQLACKNESGRTIKPVLNLNDDIIRGVMAGIEELVGEERNPSLEQACRLKANTALAAASR